MRRSLSYVIACCACVGIVSSQARAQRLVSAPPQGQPKEAYTFLYFDASGVGYLASRYVLLRTRDGGASWTRLLDTFDANRSPLRDIFFINTTTFWIYGNGGFYRTTDGGDTIEAMTTNVPSIADSARQAALRGGFFFVDDAHGSALAKGQLLTTNDGGKTWRQRRLPRTMVRPRQPSRLWFFDRQTALAIGAHTIFRTEDGGKTWSGLPGSPHIDKLSCTGPEFCVGLLTKVKSRAYLSTDAGKTWQTTTTGIDPDTDRVSALQAISPTDAVITGSHSGLGDTALLAYGPRTPIPRPPPARGLMVRWNGTSWQRREYPEIGRFWAIHFVTSTDVWASADTNGIVHSTDGGQTWTFVPDYYRRVSPPTPTWFVPFWPLPTPVQ